MVDALAAAPWARKRNLSRLPRLIASFPLAVMAGMSFLGTGTSAQVSVDYDTDDDSLIEVDSLAKLNAVRWDSDGDGQVDESPSDVEDAESWICMGEGACELVEVPPDIDDHQKNARYATAFPDAAPGMGCPGSCTGYELTVDLDFDTDNDGDVDAEDGVISWNDGQGWVPIQHSRFFDGNGHSISNMFISTSRHGVGLFGSVGTVRNLGLVDVEIEVTAEGWGYRIGGLAGAASQVGSSFVSGTVTVMSSGDGRIIGGLVGELDIGSIHSSYSDVSLTVVSDTGAPVGGLVGHMDGGEVIASYSTGFVHSSGRSSVGGLVGSMLGYGPASEVHSSYSTADVNAGGDSSVGGLVGIAHGKISISASYAAGSVGSSGTDSSIGGLVGYDLAGGASHSYWDTQTSGIADDPDDVPPEGLTTAELQTPTSFSGIYAGWPQDLWDLGTSTEYPKLRHGEAGAAMRQSSEPELGGQPVVDAPSDESETYSDSAGVIGDDSHHASGDDDDQEASAIDQSGTADDVDEVGIGKEVDDEELPADDPTVEQPEKAAQSEEDVAVLPSAAASSSDADTIDRGLSLGPIAVALVAVIVLLGAGFAVAIVLSLRRAAYRNQDYHDER